MLVRFTSSTSGEMVMLAATARRMLEAVGKACTARGVITAEQLPGTIAALRATIEAERQAAESPDDKAEDDEVDEQIPDPEAAISFSRRAQPLIRLLEWTQREEGYVLWEAPADF